MTESLVNANTYSGEAKTRREITATAEHHGYSVEQYGMADKGTTRTITVGLDGLGGANEPAWLTALVETFADHGYKLESAKIVAKATKEITNQTTLHFNTDPGQHPDHVTA